MRLCDVTVGEAAQLPGREYTVEQRVEAGRALDDLGVSMVQAGAPAAGGTERETVQRLASDLEADVVARSRARIDDVEAALDADPDVVEVVVPVSDRQLEHVLGLSRDEAFEAAEETVLRAREGGVEATLSLTDAFRAEVPAVAGAFGRFECPIVLSDTVGARTPPFVAGFLRTLADASADLTRAGVHFRDDLGCATANALVAAETGIDRIDVSVAGVGERAGTAPTEEVVVATETASGDAGVAPGETIPACEAVLAALGESVDERKAVLGEAPVTHEPGIYGDAMLDDPAAFEPFDPATFGGRRRLVFGAETERGAVRKLLERAGRDPDEELVAALLERLAEEGPLDLDAALEHAADV